MSTFGKLYDGVAEFFFEKSKTIYIYLLFFIEISQAINGNNQNNPADTEPKQEEVTYLITSLINNNLVSRMCNKMWAFLRV